MLVSLSDTEVQDIAIPDATVVTIFAVNVFKDKIFVGATLATVIVLRKMRRMAFYSCKLYFDMI